MTVALLKEKIHVGEYGFKFRLKTGVNITGYSSFTFSFKKPDDTTQDVTDTDGGVDDASEGDFYVTVPDGLFDTDGPYTVQATVEFASKKLITGVVVFPVHPVV